MYIEGIAKFAFLYNFFSKSRTQIKRDGQEKPSKVSKKAHDVGNPKKCEKNPSLSASGISKMSTIAREIKGSMSKDT